MPAEMAQKAERVGEIKAGAPDGLWADIGARPANYDALTVSAVTINPVPVTIGNVIGGGVLVGAV